MGLEWCGGTRIRNGTRDGGAPRLVHICRDGHEVVVDDVGETRGGGEDGAKRVAGVGATSVTLNVVPIVSPLRS